MDFTNLKKEIDHVLSDNLDDSIHRITNRKAELLKENYGIEIDTSPNSNFSLYTYPNSYIDAEIFSSLKETFSIIENYVSNIENQIKTPASSTFNCILTRFKEFVSNLEFISIKEEQGAITIYLVLEDIKYGMSSDEITNILEENKLAIFNAIHHLKGAGIITKGEKIVAGLASNGQTVSYKYELGKRLYVYIKVKYYLNNKDRGVSNADSRIKEIYRNVENKYYKKIGKSLDYQDFVTPTLEIDGISKIEFSYKVDENPELKIDDLSDSNFDKKNINYRTKDNEVLIFDFSSKSRYIRIDIAGEA